MSMCYAAQMHSVEFVFFAEDVVGTGRTMEVEVLRSNKYKPNMIKAAR